MSTLSPFIMLHELTDLPEHMVKVSHILGADQYYESDGTTVVTRVWLEGAGHLEVKESVEAVFMLIEEVFE